MNTPCPQFPIAPDLDIHILIEIDRHLARWLQKCPHAGQFRGCLKVQVRSHREKILPFTLTGLLCLGSTWLNCLWLKPCGFVMLLSWGTYGTPIDVIWELSFQGYGTHTHNLAFCIARHVECHMLTKLIHLQGWCKLCLCVCGGEVMNGNKNLKFSCEIKCAQTQTSLMIWFFVRS